MSEQVQQVDVTLIDAGRYQPRQRFDDDRLEELAASIRQHGVIQPIIVRPRGGRYELIAGERRFRAARKLGLDTVPAIVRPYSDGEALEAALIENLQREDITVVETARAYRRLTEEFHYTQGEVAQRTGKSRSAVANTLRLLQLPERLLELLDARELTEGHARALLALPYASLQVEVGEWAARNGMNVRETERKIRALLEPQKAPRASGGGPAPREDAHITALEEQLRQRFGTKVDVSYEGGKGAIRLEFYDDDDLYRLLELIAPDAA